MLEQLRQHPQQKGRIQLGRIHQLVGGEYVDDAAALAVGLHEVVHVEHRLAEKNIAALLLDFKQRALHGADRGRRDVAVFGGEILCVVADILQHRAQILGVEQQQAAIVSDFEHEGEHTLLGVVEIEQAPQQQRPHAGNGCAHRMARLAVDIPEHRRAGRQLRFRQIERGKTLLHLRRIAAGGGQPREVAFDVGHEHRYADIRKTFRQHLQRHRFAGAGGARDQAVAVGQRRQQTDFNFRLGDDQCFGHDGSRRTV